MTQNELNWCTYWSTELFWQFHTHSIHWKCTRWKSEETMSSCYKICSLQRWGHFVRTSGHWSTNSLLYYDVIIGPKDLIVAQMLLGFCLAMLPVYVVWTFIGRQLTELYFHAIKLKKTAQTLWVPTTIMWEYTELVWKIKALCLPEKLAKSFIVEKFQSMNYIV